MIYIFDTIKCNITNDQLQKVYDFAKRMYDEGYLRPIREGGTKNRNQLVILKNNIEGKIAEFGVFNWINDKLIKNNPDLSCDSPSDWVGNKNSYDCGYDLFLKKGNFELPLEVKSSSLFAKSLLLEEKRWSLNDSLEVINNDHKEIKAPFAFISVKVDMNWIENNMLDGFKINNKFVVQDSPKIFINGVLESKILKKCIEEKTNLFQKNDIIPTSKSTKLDAPNYIFPVWSSNLNNLYKMHKPEFGLNVIHRALKKGL